MNDRNLHIDKVTEISDSFLGKGKITWEKSEAEVWAELESKMGKKSASQSIFLLRVGVKWAAAAIFLVLVGFGSLFFFYSKTYESLPGENLVVELPDGSGVEMNVASTLKYYPLKWAFQRKVEFEGEGFFEVEKGRKFEVVSANGKTLVLGTSFNIYARNNNYRVTCLSGKVQVVTNSNESVLLLPNNHVELTEDGNFKFQQDYNVDKAIDWKMGQFDFTVRSLAEVFNEIEIQFNVEIKLSPDLKNRNFSSNFPNPNKVEKVLDFVCKPMQLQWVKQSENVFLVLEKK